MNPSEDRYARQQILPEIGVEGQQRLAQSRVLVIGCGALGGFQAELLARAGVETFRVVDRDIVDVTNLQRQILFDEIDAAAHIAKPEAAANRLRSVNSNVVVEAHAIDVTPANIESLLDGIDLVLDGTDNFETRYLINDACVKHDKTWIYGGVIGTVGMVMVIRPGSGPCLRCLMPSMPEPGSFETCDTSGVLNTAVGIVASLQATAALRILVGSGNDDGRLISVDPWNGSFQAFQMKKSEDCPCCARREYSYLDSAETSWATVLCGRNAVQVTPPRTLKVDMDALCRRLEQAGSVTKSGLLLCFEAPEGQMILFPDGRALVMDNTDKVRARNLYARYIGT